MTGSQDRRIWFTCLTRNPLSQNVRSNQALGSEVPAASLMLIPQQTALDIRIVYISQSLELDCWGASLQSIAFQSGKHIFPRLNKSRHANQTEYRLSINYTNSNPNVRTKMLRSKRIPPSAAVFWLEGSHANGRVGGPKEIYLKRQKESVDVSSIAKDFLQYMRQSNGQSFKSSAAC